MIKRFHDNRLSQFVHIGINIKKFAIFWLHLIRNSTFYLYDLHLNDFKIGLCPYYLTLSFSHDISSEIN